MGWINNGISRSLKVLVTKKVGGNIVLGYPKTYDGQLAFPGYASLTDIEARRLSNAQYTARITAFKAYVESVENGSDFDTDVVGGGPTKTDPTCTPTTTTTTSASPTAYAFTIKYGVLPVDACSGSVATVYSNVPFPGIGDFLYKDSGLTQKWDTAAAILFTSPALYGLEVVVVAIVDTPVYDPGEIMAFSGYLCTTTAAPVSTTTTTAGPTTSTLDVRVEYIGGTDANDGLKGSYSVGADNVTLTDYTKDKTTPDIINIGEVTPVNVANVEYWADGAEAIRDYQYRINGGSWVSGDPSEIINITSTGSYINLHIQFYQ